MSDTSFEVRPDTIAKAGQGMSEIAEGLISKTQALMGQVGDVSALGTNDTLGSVASMLYAAVLERVQETVDSVAEEYGVQAENLTQAAQAYQGVEQEAVASSGRMVQPQ